MKELSVILHITTYDARDVELHMFISEQMIFPTSSSNGESLGVQRKLVRISPYFSSEKSLLSKDLKMRPLTTKPKITHLQNKKETHANSRENLSSLVKKLAACHSQFTIIFLQHWSEKSLNFKQPPKTILHFTTQQHE